MYRVYKRTKNYEPISLAVVDESDNIKAMNFIMPLVGLSKGEK